MFNVYHVVVEGVCISVNEREELEHGGVEGGDDSPHLTVQVLPLLPPVAELADHGGQGAAEGSQEGGDRAATWGRGPVPHREDEVGDCLPDQEVGAAVTQAVLDHSLPSKVTVKRHSSERGQLLIKW